ncbi:hypothetical protein ACRYCC_43485 [Actinomadura scrupuli]|uniref:hypothetical protein n=1 Tax=Actinomadura scrupuli TaxID=559629 RepID=UPI003D96B6FE
MDGSGPPDETQGADPDEPELPPWPQMARPTWHNQYGPYGGYPPTGGYGPARGGPDTESEKRGCWILVCVLILLAIALALVLIYLIR